MESTPQGNIESLDISIKELVELNKELHNSNKKSYLGLNVSVQNTMLMMSAVLNSAYDGRRHSWISFTDESDWHGNMTLLNRSFFATLLNCVEKALESICESSNIDIEISRAKQSEELKSYLKEKGIVDARVNKLVNSLSSNHPGFDDYLNAVINNSPMDKQAKKNWRKIFKDLTILRNKSSHSNSALSTHEFDELKSGIFGAAVVSKEEIRFSVQDYKKIYKTVLSFYDAIE